MNEISHDVWINNKSEKPTGLASSVAYAAKEEPHTFLPFLPKNMEIGQEMRRPVPLPIDIGT